MGLQRLFDVWREWRLPRSHRRRIRAARRALTRIYEWEAARIFGYLRKIDPLMFEELILESFARTGFRVRRNRRYSGDGGIDGQVRLNGAWAPVQCKRYSALLIRPMSPISPRFCGGAGRPPDCSSTPAAPGPRPGRARPARGSPSSAAGDSLRSCRRRTPTTARNKGLNLGSEQAVAWLTARVARRANGPLHNASFAICVFPGLGTIGASLSCQRRVSSCAHHPTKRSCLFPTLPCRLVRLRLVFWNDSSSSIVRPISRAAPRRRVRSI
jgi:hypothetical protein